MTRRLWPTWKGCYSLYTLVVLMATYLVNQLDRFVLGIASRSLSKDLNFAQFGCFANTTAFLPPNFSCVGACIHIKNQSTCLESGPVQCHWDYMSTGIQYQVLAGPAFTVVFTLTAIPLGILAGYPWVNRKVAIAVCLVLWSVMTLLSSFTVTFWQLLLTRVGLGLFEAVCTPFATSIISDYFSRNHRGAALGFYNWGVYIGYSLAFAFNFILLAADWRWAFRAAAFPGVALGVLLCLSVREPKRRERASGRFSPDIRSVEENHGYSRLKQVLRCYCKPALLLLCVAGGVRQGAGLVWAYNVKAFFNQYYCGRVNVGTYLSWVPLVGGILGALVGGVISDRLVKRKVKNGRLWVLIFSQLLAAPFLVGTLFLPPEPWAFLSLLPAYIIGEMWIGVCLAVVIDLVPATVTPAGIALYLFIINNIGGTMNLLLPPLEAAISLRYALLVLYPGMYLIASALFAGTLVVMVVQRVCNKWRGVVDREDDLTASSPLIQNAKSDSDSDSDLEYDDKTVTFTESIIN